MTRILGPAEHSGRLGMATISIKQYLARGLIIASCAGYGWYRSDDVRSWESALGA